MSDMAITREFHVGIEARGRKRIRRGSEPAGSENRVPRVASLMALAIVFDHLIRDGVVADQAELAKLGRVTCARVTQIMDLLNLAPAIQEHLLATSGIAVTERRLRPLAATLGWRAQVHKWEQLAPIKLT